MIEKMEEGQIAVSTAGDAVVVQSTLAPHVYRDVYRLTPAAAISMAYMLALAGIEAHDRTRRLDTPSTLGPVTDDPDLERVIAAVLGRQGKDHDVDPGPLVPGDSSGDLVGGVVVGPDTGRVASATFGGHTTRLVRSPQACDNASA